MDANVLLYAVDEDAEHHDESRDWLDPALYGGRTVLLPWVSLIAFLRISTHPRIFESPLPVSDALANVSEWLNSPASSVPGVGAEVLPALTQFLNEAGTGGNLTNDAHLASIALTHQATVATFDSDFGRFTGVRWARPREFRDGAPREA
ncbi:TA system VapC family ribonuclease toxin [Nesterenkonia muleiensis]|uniref:TA system VapC family ribonuclease toxin n=1 Tax=Nesterenkonia muleiensis TaxID=2282648 RepID=UPI00192E49D0|nr:TA system VapC family ribonuclease toxin [Nesterenkonia muleiensis]